MNMSENPNYNLNGLFNKHLKEEISKERYMRTCPRCGEIYKTPFPKSIACKKCHKPSGGRYKPHPSKGVIK